MENGYQYNRKELKQKLLTANSQKSTVYSDGAIMAAYKFPGTKDSKLPVFMPQYMVPEFKRYVSDIINTATVGVGPNKQPARSVIAMLEEYYSTHDNPAELPEQMQFEGPIVDGDIEDLINE